MIINLDRKARLRSYELQILHRILGVGSSDVSHRNVNEDVKDNSSSDDDLDGKPGVKDIKQEHPLEHRDGNNSLPFLFLSSPSLPLKKKPLI